MVPDRTARHSNLRKLPNTDAKQNRNCIPSAFFNIKCKNAKGRSDKQKVDRQEAVLCIYRLIITKKILTFFRI